MQKIYKRPTYTSKSFTETGTTADIVATGTWVLVTHFSVTMPTSTNLAIIQDGAAATVFLLQAGADNAYISCDFPHPIMLNGLGVTTTAGLGKYTICWVEV